MCYQSNTPRQAAFLFTLAAILSACVLASPGLTDPAPSPTPPSAAVAPTANTLPTPAIAATSLTESPPTPPAMASIVFVGRLAGAPPGSVIALSLQGAQAAAAANSAQLNMIDVDQAVSAHPAAAIRQAAERLPTLVITAGSDLAEATREVARDFPQIKFLGVDQPAVDSLANYFVIGDPGNRLDEEGFLAGALAGLVTQERKVGVLAAGGTLEGKLYKNGFLHGLRYTCGDCELTVIELENINDVEAGARVARQLKNIRVDVLFAAGGAAGDAAVAAAVAQEMWVIGLGRELTTSGSRFVLGSILRRPDIALPTVVAALLAGEAPVHTPFALANETLSLSESVGPDVSPAMVHLIDDLSARLATGALDTGIDLTTGEEK